MIDDDSDCRGENDFSYNDSYHFAPMRLWLAVVIDDVEVIMTSATMLAIILIHFACNQLGNQVEHLQINKGLP